MAFGQGETVVTPIQLATAYATFANGGTRYAPELAAAVALAVGQGREALRAPRPRATSRCRRSPARRSSTGLEGAVQNPLGTAYADFVGFNFAKWNIAGKTGTATVTVSDVIQPTSWFVSFGGPRRSCSALRRLRRDQPGGLRRLGGGAGRPSDLQLPLHARGQPPGCALRATAHVHLIATPPGRGTGDPGLDCDTDDYAATRKNASWSTTRAGRGRARHPLCARSWGAPPPRKQSPPRWWELGYPPAKAARNFDLAPPSRGAATRLPAPARWFPRTPAVRVLEGTSLMSDPTTGAIDAGEPRPRASSGGVRCGARRSAGGPQV